MSEEMRKAAEAVREFALGLPGAYEDYPWGERVVKVNKKVFLFLGRDEDLEQGMGIGVKLPISGADVLHMPFAEPSGYGLGKSGWVDIRFMPDEIPPIEQMRSWIEESYRAIAPKKLVAELDKSKSR